MTRKRKIKKFIFSILGCLSLGLSCILPFINSNELVVNATNNLSVTYDSGFVPYDENFDLFGNTYLTMIEDNTNQVGTGIKVNVGGGASISGAGYYTTILIQYNRDSSSFGEEYGFRLYGHDNYGYFNGFKVEVYGDTLDLYGIYICDIYESSTNVYSSRNEELIYEYDTGDVMSDYYNQIILDNNDSSLSYNYYTSEGSITSVGGFLSWWTNTINFYSDYYNLTKWHNASTVSLNFVNLLEVYTYYGIDDNFNINIGNGILEINYNDLSIKDITNNVIYYDDYLIYRNIIDATIFTINSIDLNSYHFLRSLFTINYYPSTNDTNFNFNFNYYKLDFSLFDNVSYYTSFSFSFTLYNYSYTFHGIHFVNNGVLFSYNDNSGNYQELQVYSFLTNQYLNNLTYDTLIIAVSNSESSNINFDTLNLLINILVPEDSFPVEINGWYTFDSTPYSNIDYNFIIRYDVGFTSNSIGYNRIIVSYQHYNTEYERFVIFYVFENDNNELIRNDVVYKYEDGVSEWKNVNYRQLFFDNYYISETDYNILNDIGTFNFISNNPAGNDYTFSDLLWAIADIPYVTIRNMLGFEIFGTDLFVAFVSIFSLGVAIFILRRVF